MGRRAWVLAAVVGWALTVVAAGPAQAASKVLSERWTRVESPHLVVFGDGPRASLERLTGELETFRAVSLALLPNPRLDEREKLTVIALKDARSLERYGLAGAQEGRSWVSLGWSCTLPERGWIVMVTPNQRGARTLGFHEYAHFLTARANPFLPSWVREGLAEYWSTLVIEADGTLQLGGPNHMRLRSLDRAMLWQPLEKMLTARSLHGAGAVANLYAQAWLFMQYVSEAGQPVGEALAQYLARVRAGEQSWSAFVASFGVPPEAFQSELQRYAEGNAFAARRFRLKQTESAELVTRRARVEEVGVELGLVHALWLKRTELAHEALARVLEAEPGNGLAMMGTAWLLAAEGEAEAATALYEEAVQAAPDDGLVLFYAGRHLMKVAESSNGEGKWERAMELLRRSAEAGPEQVRGATGYAELVLETGGDEAGALRLLERSMEVRPDPGKPAALLQRLLISVGRLDEAWDLHTDLIGPMRGDRDRERSLRRLMTEERRRMLAWQLGEEALVGERCAWLEQRLGQAPRELAEFCGE